MTEVTAAMLVIGDEILSGRTRDANAHLLAGRMTDLGIRLREIRVVPDDAAGIVAAVKELAPRVTHLFTSGGIGPTHDDITADCVAAAQGAAIDVREDARAILERYYGDDLNAARLRMARIPEGAVLIDNPLSQAPGFSLGNVHVMAGVPAIFAVMLDSLAPRLVGGARMLAHALRANVPEGDLAEPLRALAPELAPVTIGSYPFYRGGLGTTLVLRCPDAAALAAAAARVRALLTELGGTVSETPP